ncbi:hypothetical protein SNE40_014657 [Patella caerulea]|uniref:Uncharacterized protein n=1 Tax=Patella caerulea TaxID=87958 RepID=A0AAN8JF52_PATCE
MGIFEVLVTVLLLWTGGEGMVPSDMCIEPVIPTPGNFYAIKVSSRFYRRAHPLEVEVYQTIGEKRPIIADVFLHAPETDIQSPGMALDVKTIGYWLGKQPSEYTVVSETISCPYSFWGNDAIVAFNDHELKFNITGNWYPPTSAYDLKQRRHVKFVAYVTPDPDKTRRRWYKAESPIIKNLDYIAIQYHIKKARQQMALFNRQMEQFN